MSASTKTTTTAKRGLFGKSLTSSLKVVPDPDTTELKEGKYVWVGAEDAEGNRPESPYTAKEVIAIISAVVLTLYVAARIGLAIRKRGQEREE